MLSHTYTTKLGGGGLVAKQGWGMGEEEFAGPQNRFEFENDISRNILEILNLGN